MIASDPGEWISSAELDEVLRLNDTVAVLRGRTPVASMPKVDLTQEALARSEGRDRFRIYDRECGKEVQCLPVVRR